MLNCPDGQAAALLFFPQSLGSCWPEVDLLPDAMTLVVHDRVCGEGGTGGILTLTPLSQHAPQHLQGLFPKTEIHEVLAAQASILFAAKSEWRAVTAAVLFVTKNLRPETGSLCQSQYGRHGRVWWVELPPLA